MKRSILMLVFAALTLPAFGQQVFWSQTGDQGYLGVQLKDVDAEDVARLNLPSETGVLITEVVAESPAAEAGLRPDDVVVEVSGLPVLSARQFQRVIADNPPGRTLTLGLFRSGSRTNLAVKLGEREGAIRGIAPRLDFRFEPPLGPDEDAPFYRFHAPRAPGVTVYSDQPRLGIEGHALSAELAQALNLGAERGVLVLSVTPDSAAAKAGLRAGDIIVTVSGAQVTNLPELRESLKEDTVDLEVLRGAQRLRLSVEMKAEKPSKGGVKL